METKMDMLHGPILKKILIFAFPIILGSVLQQLFSAVDIAVVGFTGDSNGQAAIGANTSLIALFVNFFVGLTVGINVVIGNYIGQNIINCTHCYNVCCLFGSGLVTAG